MTLLSLDPGSKAVGWAFFTNDLVAIDADTTVPHKHTLDRCGLIRGKTLIELAADASRQVRLPDSVDVKVILEKPQVYQRRNGRTKGDPNDLITIAIAGGIVLGVIMEHNSITEVELAKPAAWKMGQTPKEIENARALAALTRDEKIIYARCVESVSASLRHNVLDAVSIALFAVGRKQRRASPTKAVTGGGPPFWCPNCGQYNGTHSKKCGFDERT